ncbi:MAG TPA: type 1 glutamine amidotransferase [Myxococcota bacterium]|jgi:GMP synthase-like glutamine amidotransferase|nr:type 1 glutamine amidotransferase [Myxococcota bacterium]
MRAHVLQHVPFEGLGSMAPWLERRGHTIAWTRLFEEARFPALDAFDLLVVLGGPMSVNDEQRLAWLPPERRFVGRAIEAGKGVLGICLGAQLVAAARGAKVRPNREREIGWHVVSRTDVPRDHPCAWLLPSRLEAFHWHGETFELPEGAVRLARSEGCEQQAFALGDRVVALQFHLETTPASAGALVAHCPEDLAPGPFVQTATEMLGDPERFERIEEAQERLLEHLVLRCAARP